ncbi:MAG TPA: PD-(D/E)XK nuclease family protein [Vicinamibacterales bacterium]|nr:PD-(D/E)XK nuclease family protein [Vicinamibacterales bacterium]
MITPRRTRLVRAPDLQTFRRVIAVLASRTEAARDGDAFEPPLVVVPTRGAGHQLVRTFTAWQLHAPAVATRDDLYEILRARLRTPPRRLEPIERDVIAQAAAREAAARLRGDADDEEGGAPAHVRPGLVAEILRFYDLLRRQAQQVQRFEELIEERLRPQLEIDPGAARMLRQTRFLAATFREYERRIASADQDDEHRLRERLIGEPAARPLRHVIVTVPDWIADPDGLFVADFDLLARLPGLRQLDVVATDSTLASGFHERLHGWLPGIEEAAAGTLGAAPVSARPLLLAGTPDAPWLTVRDREEELIAAARRIRQGETGTPFDRIAIVYRRPLPYLYLAADTLGAAAIPYETSDALPLASEPASVALDLLLEFAANDFTRADTVALLRCPLFGFRTEDDRGVERPIGLDEIASLDRELSEARYLGGLPRFEELLGGTLTPAARMAAQAAVHVARALAPLAGTDRASAHLRRLIDVFASRLSEMPDADPLAARDRRARARLMAGLSALSAAAADHGDPDWTIADVAAACRRWIETETMLADRDAAAPAAPAVQLLDDQAARYGEFDDMTIVGLVEGDWPARTRRNIFYGSSLMTALGWPSEKDRRAADEGRFLDLVSSPRLRLALSTFTLEDEALVEPSILLDEIPRARLSSAPAPAIGLARIFPDETLSTDPVDTSLLDGEARRWAALRMARTPAGAPPFHGQVGAVEARPWSVSAIETYLGCPFRFFAQYVLRLEEDPDDDEVMDPRAQGEFVHGVFEAFFRSWQAAGRGAITPDNLEDARALFAAVADAAAARLPGAEAALERTRLLGSPAAAGLGEAVLRMEAERPTPVVERLLEHKLSGAFTLPTSAGPRVVQLRGKADRLDLLEDGTFRLIDYKLGWPPDRRRALQLPVYSLCAEQRLDGRHGRHWRLGEAVYLAFKGPRRIVPLFQNEEAKAEMLASAGQRAADAIDAIGRGEFPPTPDDVYRCETCSYAAVCRKDYVGDV